MVASPAILPGVHGGPDALGVPAHDFSTNSNACGPCPAVLSALQQANATRYPDPAYTALRAALAALHGVTPLLLRQLQLTQLISLLYMESGFPS